MATEPGLDPREPVSGSSAPPAVVSIDSFLEDLKQLSAGLITKSGLCELLTRETIDPRDLQPYEHWLEDRHTRNLIYRSDRIELMLLCWPAGVTTPLHTHNGQLGWMAMVSGKLLVENFRLVECDKPENQEVVGIDCLAGASSITMEKISSELCVPGGPLNTVDKHQTIHRILNAPEWNEKAVSLHIYSLPIESCVVFDLDAQKCVRRNLGYDN
ncbi:MAG TPA: cysteine dioxygenase family protein [Thermoanaerobaculia bacterium]|nr:cysteine dioxygenase family protein [Thermoanaerobaculia bacterium]